MEVVIKYNNIQSQLIITFLTVGGPCFFLDSNEFPMFKEIDKHSDTASFLKNSIKSNVDISKVKSILCISAHWEEVDYTVTYHDKGTPPLLYDYYGFPESTYKLKFSPLPDIDLANKVINILDIKGINCNRSKRGFDHGVFIPLLLALPNADIPIVQLSLKAGLDTEKHIQLGEILSPLRDEGVLIITSGALTHNLGNNYINFNTFIKIK
jgi:aromatic ring-opening dioxygenase catalytic subunit (LigB family)